MESHGAVTELSLTVVVHAVATVTTLILAVHRKMNVVVYKLVLVDMVWWSVDDFDLECSFPLCIWWMLKREEKKEIKEEKRWQAVHSLWLPNYFLF